MSHTLLLSSTNIDLTKDYGQVFIGTFIATAIWGISCMQTFIYFVTYHFDAWNFKAMVIILWLLDTVHLILCIKYLWSALIPQFGNLMNITKVRPEFLYQVPVTGVVTIIANSFFIWRIWHFTSKSWVFPVVLVPLSVGQFVAVIVFTIKATGKFEVYIKHPIMTGMVLAISINSSVIDVTIATVMCAALWRSRMGDRHINRMAMRLINASVSTGACAAFVALYSTITVCAWPHDLYFVIAEIPLCTLYCNAVLANLNARRYIQGRHLAADSTGSRIVGNSESVSFRFSTLWPDGLQGTVHRVGDGVSFTQETRRDEDELQTTS